MSLYLLIPLQRKSFYRLHGGVFGMPQSNFSQSIRKIISCLLIRVSFLSDDQKYRNSHGCLSNTVTCTNCLYCLLTNTATSQRPTETFMICSVPYHRKTLIVVEI